MQNQEFLKENRHAFLKIIRLLSQKEDITLADIHSFLKINTIEGIEPFVLPHNLSSNSDNDEQISLTSSTCANDELPEDILCADVMDIIDEQSNYTNDVLNTINDESDYVEDGVATVDEQPDYIEDAVAAVNEQPDYIEDAVAAVNERYNYIDLAMNKVSERSDYAKDDVVAMSEQSEHIEIELPKSNILHFISIKK
jgi:hypothetical protein